MEGDGGRLVGRESWERRRLRKNREPLHKLRRQRALVIATRDSEAERPGALLHAAQVCVHIPLLSCHLSY